MKTKRTIIREEEKNELIHIRNCIIHTIERSQQRLKIRLTDYDVYSLANAITSGKAKMMKRCSIDKVWYKIEVKGKKAIILFNERLMIPQTVYTLKMFNVWAYNDSTV